MKSPTPSPISDQAAGFDMLAHLARQRTWSEMTFGPGARTKGVVDHIRKELLEIEGDPTDLTEWIDVVILALDGAWRAGGSPEQIIATMVAKQTKNEGRAWPDWRTADPDKAIEHDRSGDAAPTTGGAPSDAARDVIAERGRQVTAEGWTPEHDDEHDSGQLAGAASCYARHVNERQWVFFDGRHNDYRLEPTPDYWPWDERWWKPTTPRRDLVKAGALILAEIERLDRAALLAASTGGDRK